MLKFDTLNEFVSMQHVQLQEMECASVKGAVKGELGEKVGDAVCLMGASFFLELHWK